MNTRNSGRHLKWPLVLSSLIIIIELCATAGGALTSLTIGSPLFIGSWLFKCLAVALIVTIPVLLGAYVQPEDNFVTLAGGMLVSGLIFSLIDRLTPQLPKDPRELYLMANVFAYWLMLCLLAAMAPWLKSLIRNIPVTTRRHITLAVGIIFFVTDLIWHRDFFGFRTGNTITWDAFLFLAGDWLAEDPRVKQWSNRRWAVLALVTWLAAAIHNWYRIYNVNYSPHNGINVTNHYLVGLSATQAFMLVFILVLAAWFIHNYPRQQVDLTTLLSGETILLCLMIIARSLATPYQRTNLNTYLLLGLEILGTIIVFVALCWLLNRSVRQFNRPLDLLPAIKGLARWLERNWRWWLVIAVAWALIALSYLMIWSGNNDMVVWLFHNRPTLVWLNIMILLAIFAIIMAICNHYWPALILMTAFSLVWTTASQLKIASRDEPILPTDLSMIGSVKELLSMVNGKVVIAMVVGLVVLAAIALALQHFDTNASRLSWKGRLIMAIVACAYLGSFAFANHNNTPVRHYLDNAQDVPYFYKQIRGAKINGTLLQFANNVDVTIMAKPAGYSKSTMEKLAKHYRHVGSQINKSRSGNAKSQSLIFILSESFADPRRVPGLNVNHNPIPYISQIKKHTTGGLMLSSGYGGGTANMEYMALTGLSEANFSPTLPTPYSQLVPYQKQAWSINQLFNYSQAVHPFSAQLYSRNRVYPKFKFDRFYHYGSHPALTYTSTIQNNPRVSDDATYKQTLKVLKQHHAGQFIQVATMQNHMPYLPTYYRKLHYTVSDDAAPTDNSVAKIESYTQGIHYTDGSTKAFLHRLDKVKKPVTVVWYGDHLPGIYGHVSMSQYGIALHETDYWIYSNPAATGHGRKLEKHKVVSPNDFAAMALMQMNVKVSPYYALLTRIYTDMPAMSLSTNGTDHNNTIHTGGTTFVNQHSQAVNLNRKQQRLLHDYKLVQYDLTAGHQYLFKKSFLKTPAK